MRKLSMRSVRRTHDNDTYHKGHLHGVLATLAAIAIVIGVGIMMTGGEGA